MAISRMQQPRQMYGLGSLVKKAVKGVTGAVKSIAKSDLGKAAILGAGIYGLGGGGGLSSLFGKAKSFLGGLPGAGAIGDYLGTKGGKTLLMAGAGTLLGGLASKAEQGDPEAVAATRDVGALKSYLFSGYKNLGYTDEQAQQLTDQDTAEYTSGQGAYAVGGRVGYSDGTEGPDDLYSRSYKRVMELMDEGYDFGSAVKKYMEEERENKAYGGRISLRYGGDTMGGKNDKSKSSPGPDRSRVSDRQERSHQAAVREAQAFNRNNTGPTSTPPTPKTNIFDKIKNNPIYRTVSPFVNPFSIGMSQIPIKAQQAIGIGSLLNKLGNVIFSPAGAAEFDMEAFKKAGANKGLFGANDELKAMQEYYEAATGLAAPGAKFAGANNPQAVRDFITEQSKIPFGGGSYNIDMSLVPETFLETQQDFITQKAPISFFNLGGRAGYAFGDVVDQASGIMGLPQRVNQAGVKELDLRDSGGFIPPVGVKEKADDIPAMLSNNEFVFTADAVRNMGDGNVNKGAQRMYDMMKYLEKGGRV
jgi:hypothetical protein